MWLLCFQLKGNKYSSNIEIINKLPLQTMAAYNPFYRLPFIGYRDPF